MNLSEVDFIQIFKDSWNITWKNRFLWWFGLFVALGGSGGGFSYSFNEKGASEAEREFFQKFSDFALSHLGAVLAIAIFLLIICIIFLFLGLIGRGALAKSTDRISREEKTNYQKGFQDGKKYWKKILLLGFSLFFMWLAIIIVMATPIVFLFSQKSFFLGGILLVTAIVLLIPLVLLSIFLKNYGVLYIVLGDLKVISAMEKAYELFLGNLSVSIVFALFFIPLGILATLAMILAVLPIVLIFFILGLGIYFLVGKIGAMILTGIGIFFILVAAIFLKSIWETFAGAAWVLFFQKIAAPKIKEGILEKIEEVKKDILPEIEPVKTAKINAEDE